MSEIVNYSDLDVKNVKQHYGDSLGWPGFCGGPKEYSTGLTRIIFLTPLENRPFQYILFDDIAGSKLSIIQFIKLTIHKFYQPYWI
jgi:hypothetical protein